MLLPAFPFSQKLVLLNVKAAPVGDREGVTALISLLPFDRLCWLPIDDAFNFRWMLDICGVVL